MLPVSPMLLISPMLPISQEKQLEQAVGFHRLGHLPAAKQLYLSILQDQPTQPNANYNLGAILLEEGNLTHSLPHFKAALEADPEQALYWLSYLRVLIQAGHHEDAQMVLEYGTQAGLQGEELDTLAATLQQQRAKVWPANSDTEAYLAQLFSEQNYHKIEAILLTVLESEPDWLNGWKILSDTYLMQGKDARQPAGRALALNPQDATEHCYHGLVLRKQGDIAGAARSFQHAIAINPAYAAAYNNLGIAMKDLGEVQAGIAHYRQALQLNPDYASCYSNLLFCMAHAEEVSASQLYQEHRQFALRYEVPLQAAWQPHANTRDPGRLLHIGFVSADLREHSMAYFLEPLLQHLSQAPGLCLHAYANSALQDEVTLRLRAHFAHWQTVDTLSDSALTEQVRVDGIDILVDLSGHTSGNRLLTFARKPAPIQVSWLGYLSTTGLDSMDYYLGDRYMLPTELLARQFSEKLVQLPANAPFLPSPLSPPVHALPAINNGYLTFACFNRLNKMTASTVALWARLLQAVPTARMLLAGMPEDGSYDRLVQWFQQQGVVRERLLFHPRISMQDYLALHHQVDLCLDTMPSNGVTTTFHAAWMGVPTLSLAGSSLQSRGAMAVMSHLGLAARDRQTADAEIGPGFVAENEQTFVDMGVYWASQLPRLAQIRMEMRQRYQDSILAKPEVIAHGLEQAFRQMWQLYCEGQPASAFTVQSLD